jgi:hypothetical protein
MLLQKELRPTWFDMGCTAQAEPCTVNPISESRRDPRFEFHQAYLLAVPNPV